MDQVQPELQSPATGTCDALLPLIGFVATAIYGFKYPKLLAKSEKAA